MRNTTDLVPHWSAPLLLVQTPYCSAQGLIKLTSTATTACVHTMLAVLVSGDTPQGSYLSGNDPSSCKRTLSNAWSLPILVTEGSCCSVQYLPEDPYTTTFIRSRN